MSENYDKGSRSSKSVQMHGAFRGELALFYWWHGRIIGLPGGAVNARRGTARAPRVSERSAVGRGFPILERPADIGA